MTSSKKDDELERLEISLLVDGVYQHYGCDFRNYAYASLRRRVWNVVRSERLGTVTGLLERVLHETQKRLESLRNGWLRDLVCAGATCVRGIV